MRVFFPLLTVAIAFMVIVMGPVRRNITDPDVVNFQAAFLMLDLSLVLLFAFSITLYGGARIIACATEENWWMFRLYGKMHVMFLFVIGVNNIFVVLNEYVMVDLITPTVVLAIFSVEQCFNPSFRMGVFTDFLYYLAFNQFKGLLGVNYYLRERSFDGFVTQFMLLYVVLYLPVKWRMAMYKRADFARYDLTLRQTRELQKKE